MKRRTDEAQSKLLHGSRPVHLGKREAMSTAVSLQLPKGVRQHRRAWNARGWVQASERVRNLSEDSG